MATVLDMPETSEEVQVVEAFPVLTETVVANPLESAPVAESEDEDEGLDYDDFDEDDFDDEFDDDFEEEAEDEYDVVEEFEDDFVFVDPAEKKKKEESEQSTDDGGDQEKKSDDK